MESIMDEILIGFTKKKNNSLKYNLKWLICHEWRDEKWGSNVYITSLNNNNFCYASVFTSRSNVEGICFKLAQTFSVKYLILTFYM